MRTIAPACSDQIRRPVDRDPPMGQRGQREPTAPAGRNVRPHPGPMLPAAAIRFAPAALLTTTITMWDGHSALPPPQGELAPGVIRGGSIRLLRSTHLKPRNAPQSPKDPGFKSFGIVT